jgi:hypothetical protein
LIDRQLVLTAFNKIAPIAAGIQLLQAFCSIKMVKGLVGWGV